MCVGCVCVCVCVLESVACVCCWSECVRVGECVCWRVCVCVGVCVCVRESVLRVCWRECVERECVGQSVLERVCVCVGESVLVRVCWRVCWTECVESVCACVGVSRECVSVCSRECVAESVLERVCWRECVGESVLERVCSREHARARVCRVVSLCVQPRATVVSFCVSCRCAARGVRRSCTFPPLSAGQRTSSLLPDLSVESPRVDPEPCALTTFWDTTTGLRLGPPWPSLQPHQRPGSGTHVTVPRLKARSLHPWRRPL